MRCAGIIGASGFIGSHVTKRFLTDGFKVRASTTDISDKAKHGHLSFLENSDNLELRELDCRDLDSTREFVRGLDILIHCGTPFQLEVEDPEKELLQPTITGTTNVLQAVNEEGSVGRAVIVASVGAYNTAYPMPIPGSPEDRVWAEGDEPHFSDADHPYAQAKYYADQAVRKFVAEDSRDGLDIVSVYPVGVMGASLSNREDSTSSGLQFLFKNRIAPNPFVEMLYEVDAEFAIVDVRDVAEGIFQAAVRPGLHGRGYYLSSESWSVSDISRMLNDEVPVQKARIVYSSAAAQRDLGLTFRPASQAFESYLRPAASGA
jgi:nucleoside-diphosphate-sugar epimerase